MAGEMNMRTCDPLKARQWFKLKAPTNWAITIVVVVALVFALQFVFSFFVADAIAIAIGFTLFFFVLDKQAIGIKCQRCGKHVESNTPWICGYNQCRNERVYEFPFIYQCQHCGLEPKAYQCHHCNELIFLSKDHQRTNYAKFAERLVVKPKPIKVVKDPKAEKIAKEHEEIHELEHELKVTELKAGIHEVKAKIMPLKTDQELMEESLQSFYNRNIGAEEAGRKMKAMVDIQFPNNPDERAKRYAIIDAWVRERI